MNTVSKITRLVESGCVYFKLETPRVCRDRHQKKHVTSSVLPPSRKIRETTNRKLLGSKKATNFTKVRDQLRVFVWSYPVCWRHLFSAPVEPVSIASPRVVNKTHKTATVSPFYRQPAPIRNDPEKNPKNGNSPATPPPDRESPELTETSHVSNSNQIQFQVQQSPPRDLPCVLEEFPQHPGRVARESGEGNRGPKVGCFLLRRG